MNINQRLDLLQQAANKNKPCRIALTYADGSTAIVDPIEAISLVRDSGNVIKTVEADCPEYRGLASLLSGLCQPMIGGI